MDWRCLFQKSVFESCSIEAEWIIEQSQSGGSRLRASARESVLSFQAKRLIVVRLSELLGTAVGAERSR